MKAMLSGILDLETSYRLVAMAETTTKVKASNNDEEKAMEHVIWVARISMFCKFRQIKMMEDALQSWTPTTVQDKAWIRTLVAQFKKTSAIMKKLKGCT